MARAISFVPRPQFHLAPATADLINWQDLPLAISYTQAHGIFSGSAVFYYFNTTGFGALGNFHEFIDFKFRNLIGSS